MGRICLELVTVKEFATAVLQTVAVCTEKCSHVNETNRCMKQPEKKAISIDVWNQ